MIFETPINNMVKLIVPIIPNETYFMKTLGTMYNMITSKKNNSIKYINYFNNSTIIPIKKFHKPYLTVKALIEKIH